jgi:hypothetical protein
MADLAELVIRIAIDEMPNELPEPIRFSQDHRHASYDPDAVRRFLQILLSADRVFKQFRTGFLGKASPVHFFWGSFDLAVTRFSGRRAPRHPGGVPHLSDEVACEAYSHEVSSAGFWPGSGAIDYPAFYSYAYPAEHLRGRGQFRQMGSRRAGMRAGPAGRGAASLVFLARGRLAERAAHQGGQPRMTTELAHGAIAQQIRHSTPA